MLENEDEFLCAASAGGLTLDETDRAAFVRSVEWVLDVLRCYDVVRSPAKPCDDDDCGCGDEEVFPEPESGSFLELALRPVPEKLGRRPYDFEDLIVTYTKTLWEQFSGRRAARSYTHPSSRRLRGREGGDFLRFTLAFVEAARLEIRLDPELPMPSPYTIRKALSVRRGSHGWSADELDAIEARYGTETRGLLEGA